MVRKFKHHEQKLLKKVDFLDWKSDNPHEQTMVGRFKMERREDYVKYNKICGHITRLAHLVSLLDVDDPFRQRVAQQIIEKTYATGLIPSINGGLSQLAKVNASSLCRRRLASVLVSPLHMCQTMEQASNLIRQGNVRVGSETITDPAFLVTRNAEDFVTWSRDSKIRRKINDYYGTVDDTEL
jgi:U3 small nucleolar ribonucleoprotein protein IMP3